ncbi:MAG: hypothetical protein JXJ22_01665 [Bacteroidales bacterium]|nr:hypothetical protein [Bacteroidales bacterium]
MRYFIIILLMVSCSVLPSCKKCVTCTITYEKSPGDTNIRIMEDCAKKRKINDFEELAQQVADSLNGTVVCVSE